MYRKYIKRTLDFTLSLIALIVLSPLLIVLLIAGAIIMKGNPVFVQQRPGKDEKPIYLLKLKSMTDERDKNGELLPDEERLVPYGKFLRASSLDELVSLINILKGDISIVGPRPLLMKYLPRYNEHQKRRHEVRPGLTGYAQAHGRNTLSWEEKFDMDVWYVDNVSFILDVKIILDTVIAVFKREGISSETSATMEEFMGTVTELETEAGING